MRPYNKPALVCWGLRCGSADEWREPGKRVSSVTEGSAPCHRRPSLLPSSRSPCLSLLAGLRHPRAEGARSVGRLGRELPPRGGPFLSPKAGHLCRSLRSPKPWPWGPSPLSSTDTARPPCRKQQKPVQTGDLQLRPSAGPVPEEQQRRVPAEIHLLPELLVPGLGPSMLNRNAGTRRVLPGRSPSGADQESGNKNRSAEHPRPRLDWEWGEPAQRRPQELQGSLGRRN